MEYYSGNGKGVILEWTVSTTTSMKISGSDLCPLPLCGPPGRYEMSVLGKRDAYSRARRL